jgi:hypothetical protein
VIRAVLLPSVMALLGDRNWYLPEWLAGPHPEPATGGGPGLVLQADRGGLLMRFAGLALLLV